MALIPDDVLSGLDSVKYPKTSEVYKLMKGMPALHVGDDYLQSVMEYLMTAYPIEVPDPKGKPSKQDAVT